MQNLIQFFAHAIYFFVQKKIKIISTLKIYNKNKRGGAMEIKNTPIKEQKNYGNSVFPYVINGENQKEKSEFLLWVQQNKEALKATLHQNDAILFRNFPIQSAEDFEKMLDAAEFENMDYMGGAAPRTQVTKSRILTSNESPASEAIPFHHEMSQVPNPPNYIFFCCGISAEKGGATPIIRSKRVYEQFQNINAEFANKVEQSGVRYIRVMPEKTDADSAIGRSWKETFQCTSKEEAERKMQSLGMEYQWLEDNSVKTTTAILPAIRNYQDQKMFFNSIYAAYHGWNDARNEGHKSVTLADGAYIDDTVMNTLTEKMKEDTVSFHWQEGDVLWINNNTVLHSREPYQGARKVYASIAK